ncbi:flavodoxin family protein [Naumannella sp. ID2617S]|uniref:Flavodoxin n=1 Tax=Enemella dayhoffiae TaxID=2016507 RepID=A0A255H4W9_9ACTN|nr:NAD(P)H-dependent oxidoreductase [Enemella dayhoffiae]NNG19186.1 flavodoxin family protein [Naumannella sp. ID2617S]OYO22661.1 flavodoxin [Enemella dayhoffiae]
MTTLLVVHHSPSRSVRRLTEAVLAGANFADEDVTDLADELADFEVRELEALAFARGEADHADLLAADGYLLITPANFGAMSGALKHVFDSTFLQIGGALAADGSADSSSGSTKGRPFGLLVHGRYDTAGAVRQVLGITTALGWEQAHQVVELLGDVDDEATAAAYQLGGTLAALLLG